MRRCRAKKAETVTPQEVAQSQCRTSSKHNQRHKERQLETRTEAALKDARRLQNQARVISFRLRLKLLSPKGVRSSTRHQSTHLEADEPTPIEDVPSPSGYKYVSSESRAYKCVDKHLPKTPTKKVRLIEKVYQNSSPRTHSAFKNSDVLSTAFNN